MQTLHRDDDKVRRLRALGLFHGCSRTELRHAARLVFETDVPAGSVLSREGRLCDQVFVIVDGEAAETIDGAHVARLGSGDTVGVASAGERPVGATTVTALTPMVVLAMSPREFASLLDGIPTVTRRVLAEVSARLRAVQWARFEIALAGAAPTRVSTASRRRA